MESSTRALQQQTDALRRKNATTETILKNITQERDSAVSQLVVAYGTVEQLKCENQTLKEENSELKARIDHVSKDREFAAQDRIAEEDHRHRLDKRAEAGIEKKPNVQGLTASSKAGPTSHRFQDHTGASVQRTKASANKDVNTMFDLSSNQDAKLAHAGASPHKIQIDDHQEDSDSMYECSVREATVKGSVKSSHRPQNAQNEEASRDLTYLSFIDVSFAEKRLDLKRC